MSDNATIGRAPRNREHPYVQIARQTLQDKGISFEASGMLCELLSRPDNWKVQVGQLRHRGDGKDRIYRILRELITACYIRRIDGRNERGHLVTHYLVYETPQDAADDEPVRIIPTGTPLPDTDKPDTENTDITDKRVVVSRDVKEVPVAPKIRATDAPLASDIQDSDYAAFLTNLTTPATNQVKRPNGAKANPAHADLLDVTPNANEAPPEFDMLVTVITDKLRLFGGAANVMARMLMGKAGRGEYNEYRMDVPVTSTELGDWCDWYERNNPRLNKPTTPMKLQSSILEYRAAMTNGASGGFNYQSAFTFVED